MSDDKGFLIEGRVYEVPDIGTFTIGECKVFTRLTGLTLEGVLLGMDDGTLPFVDLVRNNGGFLPSLVEIAYRREHPELTSEQVEAVIDRTNRLEMFTALLDTGDEVDADPPLSGATSAPPESSPRNSNSHEPSVEDSTVISGTSSTPSSGRPAVTLGATGTIESDTSPTSALVR